jgi:acetolactate synthase I/II/III large subunit
MTKETRLADYIASTVSQHGTDTFFMLSGGMMMHLMDAFGRVPGVRYLCNHHEQASAFAADSYARETGKLGVCLATSGPGATNVVTGLVGSYQDSIPVLFLTGQCKLRETVRGRKIPGLRQCGFLEVDIVPIVESVTKYAAFVDNPLDIRYHLEKAIHLATTGRPGPVLLDIPLDIQAAKIIPQELRGYTPETTSATLATEGELEKIIHAIQTAKRPLIIAGHGVRCANSTEIFRRLVEKWQIPVATTLMAKDIMHENHPLFVGHPGPRAQRGANFVTQAADLILFIGSSIHIQTVGYEGELFATGALKIQLDMDQAVLAKEHIGSQWKFAWDIKDYLPRLLEKVSNLPWNPPAAEKWRSTCREWKEKYCSRNEAHVYGSSDDRVNLYEFADVLSDLLSGNETLITDAGQPHPILAQAVRLKQSQRYLNPGSFAQMGYALPAALGAAMGAPEKMIVPIFGDGSLQTNVQELQTLITHNPNVKIFVINNEGYASIRNTQKTFFNGFYVGSTAESGVTLPDTEKICSAYGVPYLKCNNRGELRATITKAIRTEGLILCEVMAQVDQKILPVVPSRLMPDGNIKSKALHEMVPEIPQSLDELLKTLA